jgi:hypothetical protein
VKICWRYFEDWETSTVSQWLHEWKSQGEHCGILALLPEAEKSLVIHLQSCAMDARLPLLGAVFPQLIVQADFKRQGVLLIGLNPMPKYSLCAGLSLPNGRTAAVKTLAEWVEAEEDQDGTLLLLFDGLYAQTASFLADLYYEIGDNCRYAGINAGSESFQPMPCLFDHQQWLDDAVLGIFLPNHPGAALEHNYQIADIALTASAASGNKIARIDLEPAFDQYVKLVREQYAEEVSRENFYHMGVHFPFALVRANGELLIRIPVAVDDEGALFCVGEVPEGALLTVAHGIEVGNPDTVYKLVAQYQNLQAASGLFFFCAGRRMHLGEEGAALELAQLAASLPNQPLFGALTLGEIGNSTSGGYPLFHNATLVALPLQIKP